MSNPASPLVTRPFNDSYLLAYSAEHVTYEIDMFFGIVSVLTRPSLTIGATSTAEATRLRNALIEAFAIHLRNLVDFLYSGNPKPTDVVAADFCTARGWDAVRPPITESLKDARVRANKEIAHLTTWRMAGSPPEKAWDAAALATEIRSLLRLLVARAVSSRLSLNVATVCLG